MNNRPLMFEPERILYEDNHLIVVNKRSGELVQPDPTGDPALEDEVKEMIRIRDGKPGAVFLGVVHRIDRPVSGAVLFAKTSKALARMNETVKNRRIRKIYWAITENRPSPESGSLRHFLVRDGRTTVRSPTPRKPGSTTGCWPRAIVTGCSKSSCSPEDTTRYEPNCRR